MSPQRRLGVIWALIMLGAPQLARAEFARAPTQDLIHLRSRAPLYDQRLSYPAGRVGPVREGAWDLVVAVSHVNTWAQMPQYFFDGEFSRLELRLSYGVGPRTEVQLHAAAQRRSGGLMDGLIEGFHSAVHVTQSRRDNYPRDRLVVQTYEGDLVHTHLSDQDTGVGLLAPMLALRHALWRPRRGPLVVAEAHLRVGGVQGLRPFAVGGQELMLALGGKQRIFGGLELVLVTGSVFGLGGRAALYGMPLASVDSFLLLGLTVPLHRRVQLAAHYLKQDGIVDSARFWPMHLSTHEFVLGVRYQWVTGGSWLELGLIENSIHDANTPDFGVTVAWGVHGP